MRNAGGGGGVNFLEGGKHNLHDIKGHIKANAGEDPFEKLKNRSSTPKGAQEAGILLSGTRKDSFPGKGGSCENLNGDRKSITKNRRKGIKKTGRENKSGTVKEAGKRSV